MRTTVVLLAIAGLAGCSTLSVRVETVAEPSASISAVKRVVLAPLVNRSDNKGAAMAVRAMLARNLRTQAGLSVVEAPGNVTLDPERLDRDRAKEIAQAASADAVVTGIVFAYGYVPEQGSPPKPTVRFDVRLFAAGTPDLVWAARATGVDSPGMASGGSTLTVIADAVARQVAVDLTERK